jgi:hypothetical protein
VGLFFYYTDSIKELFCADEKRPLTTDPALQGAG